jgi:hypothetical protein
MSFKDKIAAQDFEKLIAKTPDFTDHGSYPECSFFKWRKQKLM